MNAQALRSGQVAEAAGVNPQTLRYYERRGLLPEPQRSNGGHRMYPPHAVTTLRVIKAAQRLGFTLDEVAELLEAGAHRHGRGEAGLQQRARQKIDEIDAKIADLDVIRASLTEALAAGCDDLAVCTTSPSCPLPFAELAELAELAEEERHGGSCC
ncbi:MerR family transcriptional regulator [Streptomyces sp. NPDC056479]|uniref:MerR family transcriptional regulator n=1 Tax=Streptomyces sp. NPDC056479 TaxID=3345832 RepID=UPI0036A6CDCA